MDRSPLTFVQMNCGKVEEVTFPGITFRLDFRTLARAGLHVYHLGDYAPFVAENPALERVTTPPR